MRNFGGGKRGQPTKEPLFHSLHTQTFTYSFRQEKKFTALVSLTYENIQKFNPYAIATPLRHFWWWEAWSTTLPTKKNSFLPLTHSNFYLQLLSGKIVYLIGQFDFGKFSNSIHTLLTLPWDILGIGKCGQPRFPPKNASFLPLTHSILYLQLPLCIKYLPHRSVWLCKTIENSIHTPIRSPKNASFLPLTNSNLFLQLLSYVKKFTI